MEPISEEKLIKNCDAIVFASVEGDEDIFTTMHFFKTPKDSVEPTDTGFKYNVMLWRLHDELDMFTAIIGDPRGYVENMGKMGYHGILFKKGTWCSPEFKDMVKRILSKWGFSQDQQKHIYQSTVN